jgi:hypothetical protein
MLGRRFALKSAADLALRCESAALFIGESQALLPELFLEHAVLLDEVVDGLGLVAVDPAGESREEELESEEIGHVPTAIGVIDVLAQASVSRRDLISAEISDRTGFTL